MKLQTAIEILEYHQEWRLGNREDMIYEPKKLTEALDIVLSEVKKFRLLPPVNSKRQMKKVKVENRLGVTTSVIPHRNGTYPVWFKDTVEFIEASKVVFL
jgi:hypothetical protein